MADILPFASGARKRARRRHEGISSGSTSGEVVIFPGIRVEYHDQTPTPPGKPRQRRGKHTSDDALSA